MTDLDRLPEQIRKFVAYKTVVQGCSERTVAAYAYDLTVFFSYYINVRSSRAPESEVTNEELCEKCDLGLIKSVTRTDVLEYLYYASKKKNGTATRARKLSSIRSFYRYLHKNEHLVDENPAQDIETPPRSKKFPKYLEEDESVDLLETCADSGDANAVRDYAIITMFLNCGMRVSELCGISLDDFSGDLEKVRVTGKGAKERTVYLNEACREALRDYLKIRNAIPDIKPDSKNALFISRNKRRISVQTVQWVVYKYVDRAGLSGKGISVHKLRHTAATLMYRSGQVDIRTIKDILGHEQLNTTQIYTHVSSRQMQSAMEANPLSGIKKSGKGS